jgi:hypothetical protein
VRVNILSYNIKKWLEDTSFQITKIFDSAKQSNKLFVVFVFLFYLFQFIICRQMNLTSTASSVSLLSFTGVSSS